MGSVRGGT